MISVEAISVGFSGTSLFSDVTFALNENDKIALMGEMVKKNVLILDEPTNHLDILKPHSFPNFKTVLFPFNFVKNVNCKRCMLKIFTSLKEAEALA